MSTGKTYRVALSKEPAVVIEQARAKASTNGVEFHGDETEGRFAGKGLQGTYRIEGSQLSLTIAKKPMILPWGVIESSIKSFFA
jgi:hypothetical protein